MLRNWWSQLGKCGHLLKDKSLGGLWQRNSPWCPDNFDDTESLRAFPRCVWDSGNKLLCLHNIFGLLVSVKGQHLPAIYIYLEKWKIQKAEIRPLKIQISSVTENLVSELISWNMVNISNGLFPTAEYCYIFRAKWETAPLWTGGLYFLGQKKYIHKSKCYASEITSKSDF